MVCRDKNFISYISWNFLCSSEYKNALNEVEKILNTALDEIDTYCDMNNWLVDIFKFCLKWTSDSPKEYRGAPAFTIEVCWFSQIATCIL